jgi:hypothetical protein
MLCRLLSSKRGYKDQFVINPRANLPHHLIVALRPSWNCLLRSLAVAIACRFASPHLACSAGTAIVRCGNLGTARLVVVSAS